MYSSGSSGLLPPIGSQTPISAALMGRGAKTALRGNYAIWLSRSSKAFQQITLIPMPNIKKARRLWPRKLNYTDNPPNGLVRSPGTSAEVANYQAEAL